MAKKESIEIDLSIEMYMESLDYLLKSSSDAVDELNKMFSQNPPNKYVVNLSAQVSTLATESKKSIGDMVNSFKSGFDKISSVVNIAISAFKLLEKGGAWISDYIDKQREANDVIYRGGKVIKKALEAMNEMRDAGLQQYEALNFTTEAYKRYNDELMTLIDNEGKVIENKERVEFLVSQLNSEFPDSISWIDEETLSITNQSKAIENLITKKQAQYKLDSMEAEYFADINAQKEDTDLLLELKEKRDKLFQEYNDVLNDDSKSIEQLSAIEVELEIANTTLQQQIDLMNERNEKIAQYEGLQAAIFTDDYEAMNHLIQDQSDLLQADASKGSGFLGDLETQLQEKRKQLEEYYDSVNSLGLKANESEEKRLQEEIRLAEEQLEQQKLMMELGVEFKANQGQEEGNAYEESIMEALKECGIKQIDQAELDALESILKIKNVAEGAIIPEVVIPVYYRLMNSQPSPSSAQIGSYHPYGITNYSLAAETEGFVGLGVAEMDMLAQTSSDVIGGIGLGISRSILSFNTPAVINSVKTTPVMVQQSNNFYQAIERPSDITRKIEQVNRNLLKQR